MKQKITTFLFRRKFFKGLKIFKNKKGFSMIEIMVAVGILGIITSFAVPQYRSYQRTARYGVVRSVLDIPYRVVEIEESQNGNLSGVGAGFLWARVKSKAKGHFATPTFTKDSTGKKWCLLVKGSANTPYDGYEGCISDVGNVMIGGSNVPCNQDKAYIKDTDTTTAFNCSSATKACGTGCKVVGNDLPACADGVDQKRDCEADTSDVFSRTLTCTAGVCGS